MVSLDFHCKENDGTTGAAHLIQTSLAISPDIRRVRSLANHRSLDFHQNRSELSLLLQLVCYFPYNENPTRALNTTSLKCCLPSTDTTDRWEKNSHMRMKVQGCLMQVHFIEIQQLFAKKKSHIFF